MEENTPQNTIDLRHLWQLVKQNIIKILVWAVLLGIAGFAIAEFVITPKYTSNAQILVNQKKNTNDPNAVYTAQQANMQMVNTYKDIITSPVILRDASSYLENPVRVVRKATKAVYKRNADGRRVLVKAAQPAVTERDGKSYSVSVGQMQKAVGVQTQQQSQVFTLTATADTPDKAQAIANSVARTFSEKVPDIMSVDNVTIVSTATKGAKSFPDTKLFTLAGILLGLIISFAIILIKDATNTTVRTDEYMTEELGLTNLGTVTHFHLSNSFSINKQNKSNKRRRV